MVVVDAASLLLVYAELDAAAIGFVCFAVVFLLEVDEPATVLDESTARVFVFVAEDAVEVLLLTIMGTGVGLDLCVVVCAAVVGDPVVAPGFKLWQSCCGPTPAR